MELVNIILYVLIGALLITLALCLAIANYASENLITIYNKYSRYIGSHTNALQIARLISYNEFNNSITCTVIPGVLTDHYYNGTISLSQKVAQGNNISALSVCAHEMGHAIQYRDTPKKMKMQSLA